MQKPRQRAAVLQQEKRKMKKKEIVKYLSLLYREFVKKKRG